MGKKLVLTFIGLCLWCSQLPAADLPSRDEVLRMVYNEQFDQLENLAAKLRAQKVEFYNGPSQLSIFDGYLSGFSRATPDDKWQEYIGKLKDWSAAHPESPTPLIALGNTYRSWAWKARGSGWAKDVTKEGWRLFEERLAAAHQYLDQADQLSVKDPELYDAMIWVGIGEGWSKDKIDAAFQKGVKLEPNDLELYESKAAYLLPRWYGQPGDWEAFASEAADARGGDDGDILYMCIARSQAWSEGADFFKNTTISYARMKRGFEASLRRYPNYVWEMNSFCSFACIAGDRATAKRLFEQINGRWERTVWRNENNFKRWEHWALGGGEMPTASNPASPSGNRVHLRFVFVVIASVWAGLLLVGGFVIWLVTRRSKKPPGMPVNG